MAVFPLAREDSPITLHLRSLDGLPGASGLGDNITVVRKDSSPAPLPEPLTCTLARRQQTGCRASTARAAVALERGRVQEARVWEDNYPNHGRLQTTSARCVACKQPRKDNVSSVISHEGKTMYEAEEKDQKNPKNKPSQLG